MSYQVLARKWRPKNFHEMVGQEHVLKALINALDHERLHHAYLFTGTRGVGKTTIARILARCFNCEQGISSVPCGECPTCVEIGEGRLVDLIEVDAASRTKVEDTRELLDNVQYAPTRSRYKIYLIDEVHMLSNHSFNALLKTLEEPPEHVKFLLATTDPQKLPVTILSRCLQFNLKNMSPERIVKHLQYVLGQEVVPFDDPALWLLAHAAQGSMRDALSLTDQAIAFGNGNVAEGDVAAMLGTINPRLVQNLIEALITEDAKQMLALVAAFAEHAPDYSAALADLLNMLHRIAVAQAAPEALDNSLGDREAILKFAETIAPEDIQLFYQTALVGRRDLSFAANPRSGFEMTLLRMLAFKPQGLAQLPSRALKKQTSASSVEGGAATPSQSGQSSQSSHSKELPGAEAAGSGKKPIAEAAQALDTHPAHREPLASTTETGVPSASATSREPYQSEPMVAPAAEVAESSQPANHAVNKGVSNSVREQVKQDKPLAPGHSAEPAQVHREPQPATGGNSKPSSAALREQIKAIAGSEGFVNKPRAVEQAPASPPPSAHGEETKIALSQLTAQTWVSVYKQLKIKGILQSTASNCVLVGREQNFISMAMDDTKGTLFDPSHIDRLQGLLCDYFGEPVKLEINLMPLDATADTPASVIEREKQEKYRSVVQNLQADPVVQTLQREFGASIVEDSIKGHQ